MKRFWQKAIIAWIILLPLLLSAQDNPVSLNDITSSLILEINIEGNNRIQEELIRSLLAFDIGDILTTKESSKTIQNLYNLEVFDDVSISASSQKKGIVVTVHLKELPVIRRIKFKGNKKLSDKKLQELITLETGNYYAKFRQPEIKSQIMEEYKKKNYHYAQITINDELDEKNNLVDLTINIEEGEKIVVRKISIHGNREIKDKKLLSRMKVKKAGFFRTGKLDEEKFQEDLNDIISYYTRNGYIDAHILSHEMKLTPKGFHIDIYLFEGTSYTFGDVYFTGNTVFTNEELRANFKFKENAVFNKEKFDAQMGGVSSMYYEEGYIYSVINPKQVKRGSQVDFKVSITENTRAKIHKIHLRGNRSTKEKVIRRQLMIAPGDYFQQSRVRATLSNIYNTGFFEPDLYPDYQVINRNGDIDLVINMNDKISGSANGGIALNSQDGIVGQLGISHNNILGNSWQISLAWEFGGSSQNLDLSFTNPYFLDSNVLTGFNAYFTTREYDTYKLRKQGGSIKVGLPLSIVNRSKATLGYAYYVKKYRILDGTDEDEVSTELQKLVDKNWVQNSSLSLTLSRDNRDNIYFPTTGSQFVLYSEVAGGILQGDNNYFKQIFQANWYVRTFRDFALRAKWRFGYVTGFSGDNAPPDERFYLGGTGADGIRGYANQSIGPVDEYGNNEGGDRAIIFSAEYVIPVVKDQIAFLSFFDTGDCYNNFSEFDIWEMKKGVGLGCRIFSPFGLIGFDYAYNLSNRKWEPHFQFGTTF
ncbi:MAG: outer membrane protein assembly factor BamA [Candidatus Cloacimonetes bacterium]|nr:outer membrane protein assembly factor BamA [Candidatus Cloacimonadota bacterium]